MRSVKLWLSSCAFALLLSSCAQTIPAIDACSVAGVLADGADCANTLQDGARSLTLGQVIALLEAQEARECVPVPGMNLCDPEGQGEPVLLPARGGALMIPAEDFAKLKTFIEQTCRRMKCKAEVIQAVERIERVRAPLL